VINIQTPKATIVGRSVSVHCVFLVIDSIQSPPAVEISKLHSIIKRGIPFIRNGAEMSFATRTAANAVARMTMAPPIRLALEKLARVLLFCMASNR